MNILFLTDSQEDYLADSILHGLISLGIDVVDYPRKHVLYAERSMRHVDPRLRVRGHGFSLYGMLPDRTVDRTYVIQRLKAGLFDLVVIGQIWRQWGQLLDLAPLLQTIPVILLDGDDDTRIFHHSGTRLRRYGWQPFPIRSGRCLYLKRELQFEQSHSRRCRYLPVSFSIPADKIRPIDFQGKDQLLATHCVDPEVAQAYGLHTSYAFDTEEAYYDNLASSLFAVTTKRGGWDCLRHYEIAAAGALPCIRQLETKPASCAPHGLQHAVNCISYKNLTDLDQQLKLLSSDKLRYQKLLNASRDWVANSTTIAVAQRLLDSVSDL